MNWNAVVSSKRKPKMQKLLVLHDDGYWRLGEVLEVPGGHIHVPVPSGLCLSKKWYAEYQRELDRYARVLSP